MKYLIILFIFLGACSEESKEQPKDMIKPTFTILALGDSLTEGLGVDEKDNYPSVLQQLLPESINVVNAGLSGETSAGLKNRINWVLKQKPKLTILTIGANDAIRGLPLSLTLKNIDETISIIQDSGSDVILSGMQIYDNLGKEYVKGFSQIYPKLAKKHNIPLITFFLEGVAGNPKFNQEDMLHPNAEGYRIIVTQNILPVVKDYLFKNVQL